jgi:signal transduction histidine kinase
VQYSDDGKGIDPEAEPAGIGLQNIRERVASLRGSFHLDNAWPQGYSIHILIPLI